MTTKYPMTLDFFRNRSQRPKTVARSAVAQERTASITASAFGRAVGFERSLFSKTLLLVALAWTLPSLPVFPQAQHAQDTQSNATDKEGVTLNFQNADIQQVIKTVGMITGKNFLIDPRVSGTINIISNGPVPKDLVYPTLLSALRVQGFAAVEQQGLVKIVPEADAKLNSTITTDKPTSARGDRMITQIYQLQHENAAQLIPVLRPLISPNNVIMAYPGNNTLVIADYAENVRRIIKIIQSIDQPPQGDIATIPLQYASAVDVAQLLGRLIPEAAQQTNIPGSSPKVTITVDPRSNTLYVRADSPSYAQRVKVLVAGMDTPAAATGNIHVVYLRNAEATKVAETLRALLAGGQASSSIGPTPTQQPTPQNAPGGLPSAIQPTAGGSGGSSQQATPSTIQAYAATNSLIITATDHVYRSLRSVIDKLDARRSQVFVEALIVEVSSTKAAEFGIQWQDLTGINEPGTNIIGGTNFTAGPGGSTGTNIITASGNIAAVSAGLNVGVVRGTITINGQQFLNLGMLARALENDSAANILSTPNILTLDNEEAKIIVGQNVPFVTGSFTQTGTTTSPTNPFQTIERKDVGLTLKVKPQVAEGGSVKLQIFQEVSSVTNDARLVGSADVITNKRSIESTVLVDDGQIIVLGGLVQDDSQSNKSGIPILSKIPILGNLFRSETRNRTKTNLMVFLRPLVLRDDKAGMQITEDRYDYIRNQQLKAKPGDHLILPNFDGPLLPPVGDQAQPSNGYTPPAAPTAPAPAPQEQR